MDKHRGHLRPASRLVLDRKEAFLDLYNRRNDKGIKLAEKLSAATRLGIRRRMANVEIE
jgi:hypothetical protein